MRLGGQMITAHAMYLRSLAEDLCCMSYPPLFSPLYIFICTNMIAKAFSDGQSDF